MASFIECPSCGTEVSKAATKCPFCGAKLRKPFYKRGGFVFLVWVCILGGLGYVGATQFGLDYIDLAKKGGTWLHNVIVAEEPAAETPTEAVPADTPAPEKEAAANTETAAEPEKAPEKEAAEEATEAEPAQEAADEEEAAEEEVPVVAPVETAETQATAEKPAEKPIENSNGVISCTAAEITKSFEENVLAGNLDYRGKRCQVSGTIRNFGEVGDQAYVVLEGWNSGSLVGVRCFVDSAEDIKVLAGMKSGQRLTMEGTCVGLSVNVDLTQAQIISADFAAEGKVPANAAAKKPAGTSAVKEPAAAAPTEPAAEAPAEIEAPEAAPTVPTANDAAQAQ